MASNFGTNGVTSPTQVVTHMPTNMVQVAPEAPHPAANHKKAFIILGAIQISIGSLTIIFGGVIIGLYHEIQYPAYGIWSGVWYIICGGLAVLTGKRPNRCSVITGLIFSVVTCNLAFGVGVGESVLAALWNCFGTALRSCTSNPVYIGIHGTLAFLAFVEFIVAIVHSVYCCSGSCGASSQQGAVLRTTTTTTYVNVPGIQSQFPVQQDYAQPQYYSQPMAMQSHPAQMTGYANYERQTPPPIYENAKQAI